MRPFGARRQYARLDLRVHRMALARKSVFDLLRKRLMIVVVGEQKELAGRRAEKVDHRRVNRSVAFGTAFMPDKDHVVVVGLAEGHLGEKLADQKRPDIRRSIDRAVVSQKP